MVKRVDETNGDYDFLGYLVKTLVEENVMGSDGGILVFLRGASGQAGRVGKGSAINLFRNIHMPTSTSTLHRESRDAPSTKRCFHCSFFSCPWLVYNSIVKTSKPFLRDATECSAYAPLLFGGVLDVEERVYDAGKFPSRTFVLPLFQSKPSNSSASSESWVAPVQNRNRRTILRSVKTDKRTSNSLSHPVTTLVPTANLVPFCTTSSNHA